MRASPCCGARIGLPSQHSFAFYDPQMLAKGKLDTLDAAEGILYNRATPAKTKRPPERVAFQRGLNVISGAAVAPLCTSLFIDLCQCAFHKGRGTADQSNDPHPEHRSKAADAQRGGNADDIARSHTGGCGHHQRAEGGNALAVSRLLPHHAKLLAKHRELYTLGAEGEIKPSQYKQNDQHVAIKRVVCNRNDLFKHMIAPLFYSMALYHFAA